MITSTFCNLRLVPLEQVLQFGEASSQARVVTVGENYVPALVPGSLNVSDTPKDGLYQKNISFHVGNCNEWESLFLDVLSKTPLIAFYDDEHGFARVSGSPSYPLSLSVQQAGAVYVCTLTGSSLTPDPYID